MTFSGILMWAINWVKLHPTAATMGLYYVMSAFIGSLSMPDNTSGGFYRFFFKFVNVLAANFARAQASTTYVGYQPPKPDTPLGARDPEPKTK